MININLNINLQQYSINNQKDVANLLKLIICDIEQGASFGFIRDTKTGSEQNEWRVDIKK